MAKNLGGPRSRLTAGGGMRPLPTMEGLVPHGASV
jgi:hypothetical protein